MYSTWTSSRGKFTWTWTCSIGPHWFWFLNFWCGNFLSWILNFSQGVASTLKNFWNFELLKFWIIEILNCWIIEFLKFSGGGSKSRKGCAWRGTRQPTSQIGTTLLETKDIQGLWPIRWILGIFKLWKLWFKLMRVLRESRILRETTRCAGRICFGSCEGVGRRCGRSASRYFFGLVVHASINYNSLKQRQW